MKVINTINTEKKDKKNLTEPAESKFTFIFTKTNYLIMVVGLIFIALGYILMIGGGSEDPTQFSDKIFDSQRLVIAPILLVIGFIIEIFAIMYRRKENIN